jgi:CRP-like cAMP-binding protein
MSEAERHDFDNFRPKLVMGRVTPQGAKLVFESEKKHRQIILPIELADLLILCNGQRSMREIVEKIYKRQGAVHFKTIFGAVYRLKEKGFFENGSELLYSKSNFRFIDSGKSIFYRPLAEIYFGQRISNEETHPLVFYLISMTTIALAILGMQSMDSEFLNVKFLRVEGSYALGVLYVFGLSSILLSAKSLLKTLLLLFLAGKAYNFRLVFSLLGSYLKVGNESLFLVTNRLYLTIFHGSLILCYFSFIYGIHLLAPNSEFFDQSVFIAAVLALIELNPFYGESEISLYFKALWDDDGLNQVTHYYRDKNIFSLLHDEIYLSPQNGALAPYAYLAATWLSVSAIAVWRVFSENYSLVVYSFQTESAGEKAGALAFVGLTLFSIFSLLKYLMLSLGTSMEILLKSTYRKLVAHHKVKDSGVATADNLIYIVRDLPLLSCFSESLLRKILDGSKMRHFPTGSCVILQGDIGHHLYVLVRGALSVHRSIESKEEFVSEILPPSIFGEIAVIEQVKRTSTVIAEEGSDVLEIPGDLIRSVSNESQYVREIGDFKNAIMVSQFFSSAPMFRHLPEDIVQLFLSKGLIEVFSPNEIIYHQGSKGDGFYLLVRGTVGVVINGILIKKIRQGGFFGEISSVADISRTASIVALENVLVLKINNEGFWDIITQNIEMAMFIETVSETRIQEDIEILRGKPSTSQSRAS